MHIPHYPSRSILYGFIPILFLLILFSIRPITMGDIGLHLKSGQLMWEQKQILQADPFSYTVPGTQWINHQWLAQLITYALYALGGYTALIMSSVLIMLCTFLILYKISSVKNFIGTPLLLMLIVLFSEWMIEPRPHTGTWLLFCLYIYRLFSHRENTGIYYDALLLILLQLLWANLHGAYILGICLIGLAMMSDILHRITGAPFFTRYTAQQSSCLLLPILWILAVAACLCNPAGWRLLLRPFTQLTTPVYMNRLGEWASLFTPLGPVTPHFILPFILYTILGGIILLCSLRKLRFSDIILTLCFFILAVKSRRNLILFGYASLPVIASYGCALQETFLNKRPRLSTVCAWGICALVWGITLIHIPAVISNRYYMSSREAWYYGLGLNQTTIPEKAFEQLKRIHTTGNIFNSFGIAGYVIWKGYPSYKVFIDGRNVMYGPELFNTYLSVCEQPAQWDNLVFKYTITRAIIGLHESGTEKLIAYLFNRPDWSLVWIDGIAAVFVKKEARAETDTTQVLYPDLGIAPSCSARAHPANLMNAINLARFFVVTEQYHDALRLYGKILYLWPAYSEGWNNVGVLYTQQHQYTFAVHAFQQAVYYNPRYTRARQNLEKTITRGQQPISSRRSS